MGLADYSPKVSFLIGVAGFGVGMWAGYVHNKGGSIAHAEPEIMDPLLLSLIPFLSGAYSMIGAGFRKDIYEHQLKLQRKEIEKFYGPETISKMEGIVENKDHVIEKGIKGVSISGLATVVGYGIGGLISTLT